MERRDVEMCGAFGQLMALEVAITALLWSHPDKEALRRNWVFAQDMGFIWTSDPQGVDVERTRLIQEEYAGTLARLREAAMRL